MRRFRRGFGRKLRLIPVDSTKNIVQFTNFNVAANTITNQVIVDTFDSAQLAVANQVEGGCMIPSIEIHVRATEDAQGQVGPVHIALYKKPSGISIMTAAQISALGVDPIKRFVLHFDQLHLNSTSQVMEWHIRVKLPRTFKQFAVNDQLILAMHSTVGVTSWCGFVLYKWYR